MEILAKSHKLDFWSDSRIGSEKRTVADYERMLEGIGVKVLPRCFGDIRLPLAANVYDVVICEFWNCAEIAAPEVRRLQPWAYFVVDSVDVHFLREEAGLSRGVGTGQEVQNNKNREIKAYRDSDAVIVVTQEDRSALDTVGGVRRQVVVPNLVTARSRQSKNRNNELLFIGGFWHQPNVDGIIWFAREVFPLIRIAVPTVRLLVVGSNAPAEVKALGLEQGVEFIGFVEDTAPYLDRAAISVAPLRYGGGMKGKVTEAMAAGVPVVTTAFGAQGLSVQHGDHLLVGDTPEQFANNVIELLLDPVRAQLMGLRGQSKVLQVCGPGIIEDRLKELLISESVFGAPPHAHWRLLPSRVRCIGFYGVKAVVRSAVRRFRDVLRKSFGMGKRFNSTLMR